MASFYNKLVVISRIAVHITL